MNPPSEPSKPDWWRENERLRRRLGLPAYEPAQFLDGTYTHVVVRKLEETHDCEIQFRSSVNPAYPDDWSVRIDRQTVGHIGRSRDDKGNTTYELTSDEFRAMVGSYVEVGSDVEFDADVP
ncbi:MAG: hypothetical protein ACQETI_00220 [Halobacteriota archaeon]